MTAPYRKKLIEVGLPLVAIKWVLNELREHGKAHSVLPEATPCGRADPPIRADQVCPMVSRVSVIPI
jgi:hypothetical protein